MRKPRQLSQLTLSLLSVLASFVVAVIVMLLTGINPLSFFVSIIRTMTGLDVRTMDFNPRYVGEFIQISLPIILAALAVGFAFKTGLFNIGAEGQVMMGSLGAVICGIFFDLPMIIHLPMTLLFAAFFGAMWGFVPGILKAKFGISEVVVTIMFNYIALHLTGMVQRFIPGTWNQRTINILPSASLKSELLSSITGNSRLHWGIIVVLISILIYHMVINKTVFGYELRAVGHNPHAAEYAGMKVQSRVVYSMMISGAFAGLAGAMLVMGTFGYGRIIHGFENYGFDGLAVALLGANNALGILLGGLLFGGLKSSQAMMQSQGIPLEITQIVTGLIILFIAMQYAIDRFFNRKRKEQQDGSH